MGRLIDADAEIRKIEQEIEKEQEKIKGWQERQEKHEVSRYLADERIREAQRNIHECRKEIKLLKNYETAYNADEATEKLEKERKKRGEYIKQAIQNCFMVRKHEHPGIEEGMCAGLRTLHGNGEPCEVCKECALLYLDDCMERG